MKHFSLLLLVLSLGTLLGSALFSQPSFAEELQEPIPQTIAISPAILEKTAARGSVSKHKVYVTNSGESPQSIRVYARAFIPNEVVPPQYLSIYDTSRWFKINQPDIILMPGESQQVTFTLSIPDKAEPGGHYATIYFEQLIPASLARQGKVIAAPRVGMLAFLTVKGNVKENLWVKNFSAPTINQKGPIDFSISFKNDGNVHVLPSGKVRISNLFGKKVHDEYILPGMVLPKTERVFTISWNKPKKFGIYSAQAFITYGTPGKSLTSQKVSFLITPWLSTLVIMIFLAIAIWVGLRAHGHWRKAWKTLSDPETSPKPPSVNKTDVITANKTSAKTVGITTVNKTVSAENNTAGKIVGKTYIKTASKKTAKTAAKRARKKSHKS